MLSKEEILNWNRKYDKDHPWWVEKESELGDKFRKTKEVTKSDLLQVVEWKFKDLPWKNDRLKDVANIDDTEIRRKSHDVFCMSSENDLDKVNGLKFYGVGTATISAVLTFYNPEEYGVFDRHVWREFFGKEPKNEYLWTAENYLKLLAELRKIASQYSLNARTVEKAYFKKNLYETSS